MASTFRASILNGSPVIPVESGFFADVRFDTDDSAPTYIGMNILNGASTASSDWKIFKFTYSGANVTRTQISYGAWDSRASLFS